MSVRRRQTVERIMMALMRISLTLVLACVAAIAGVVIVRGAGALSWEMLTRTPSGGFYLGKGGGIANAIVGSVLLSVGATVLSLCISLPAACALQKLYMPAPARKLIALTLDVLWGVPSVVYGAFCFLVMVRLGIGASLGGGIIALALVITPFMIRGMAESLRAVPDALCESACALGTTRLELTVRIMLRQSVPGLVTAVLLSFGRAIGDAAALLFTAGYSDYMPRSLADPAASLPLAIFFQLGTPIPEVQRRAYASALVLLLIVLAVIAAARACARSFSVYVVR